MLTNRIHDESPERQASPRVLNALFSAPTYGAAERRVL